MKSILISFEPVLDWLIQTAQGRTQDRASLAYLLELLVKDYLCTQHEEDWMILENMLHDLNLEDFEHSELAPQVYEQIRRTVAVQLPSFKAYDAAHWIAYDDLQCIGQANYLLLVSEAQLQRLEQC